MSLQQSEHADPKLSLQIEETSFRRGDTFVISLGLSSPSSGLVHLELNAPAGISLAQKKLDVQVQAGEPQTIRVHGTMNRAGYYNITVTAQSQAWYEQQSQMLGFHVAPAATNSVVMKSNPNAVRAQGGLEPLESRLETMPLVKTSEAYIQRQVELIKAEAEGRDDIDLDARIDGVVLPGQTEPMNVIQHYAPGTGSGKPSASDLAGKPIGQDGRFKPMGIGCGPGEWSYVSVKITYLGQTLPLGYTKITVYDDNPWLAPSMVSWGYTDANGLFAFQRPTCDYGAFWDNSGPDIYFTVDTIDSRQISLGTALGALWQYRSATNWDTASSSFTLDLAAHGSDAENALSAFKMTQLASDFNAKAGGDGGVNFGVHTVWPAILTGVSYTVVSRLNLLGSDWILPLTIFHEFGHEVMYYTADPARYDAAFRSPGAIFFPVFAFGSHDGYEQQNYQLAYNEGWGNYFGFLVMQYTGYDASSRIPFAYYACNGLSCNINGQPVWPGGGENEHRISTFLYRYTSEVLKPVLGSHIAGFGAIRSKLWKVGKYNVDIHDAWAWWVKPTMPPMYTSTVRTIGVDTFMDLSRII